MLFLQKIRPKGNIDFIRFFLIYFFLNFSLLGCPNPDPLKSSSVLEKKSIEITGEGVETAEEGTAVTLTDNPQEGTALSAESLTNNAQKSIWKVSNSSFSGLGTALSVGPNLFVMDFYTMAAIVENDSSIKDIVLEQEHSSSQLKVKQMIRVSALYGLIFFETEENVTNYLNISKHQPQPDDELSILGYSQGEFQELRKTGKLVDNGYFYTFPVNSSSLAGSGGSPVLNEKWQVIGILSKVSANIIFVVKTNDLRNLIAGNIGLDCSSFSDSNMCVEKEMINLQQLADQGRDALAQYNLGKIYSNDVGVTQDYNFAFELYQKSAEQGNVMAQKNLGVMYSEGKGTAQDYTLAFEWFQKSAEQGYVPSQYLLAMMYFNGVGVAQDYTLAFEWFQKSANQGYTLSQYLLAMMYSSGVGTVQNHDKVLEWLKKSVDQGNVLAQNDLAMMYYNGEGVEQDYNLAFSLFQKSAEQGHLPAQYSLASMYYNSVGAEKDLDMAFTLFQRSAEQGHLPSQHSLASMYYNGVGTEKDLDMAFALFQRSARQGYPPSQYNLASMYFNGEGTEQNPDLAIALLQMSASKGYVPARQLLTDLYNRNREQPTSN